MPDASTPSTSPMVQWVGFLLGPLLLLACSVSAPPAGLTAQAWATAGLALLMATWWSTEAIPIPATALVPLLLVPLLGIGSIEDVAARYANPIIFLFLGGFVLGLAVERCGLHRRIALATLLAIGSEPRRQIAGFMLVTAFLSMWVSNTATTIMMLPIGLSVAGLLAGGRPGDERSERFTILLLLAIAYAASIGGVATLIGTPPNALLAGFLAENHGIQIGFGRWMLLGVPISAILLSLTWWWLTRTGLPPSNIEGTEAVRRALADLGALGRAERLVACVFFTTALAWVLRPLLAQLIPGLDDTSIAIAAALALFSIPVDVRRREFAMDWTTAARLPWGVLLLFGGGLALAGAITDTGLALWIAKGFGSLGMLPALALLAVVVTVMIFLTEITSNTAIAATFLPLLGALAVSQGIPPEMLAIPAAIAASCAFMMPVATPPNAIVFATGHVPIGAMIRAGLVINLFGIVVVTLSAFVAIDWIWPR